MSDLINTLESPGEFDALRSLRQDEPYFLLVGRDRLAPRLIDEWADQNRRRALAKFDEGLITKELRDRECRKSTEAEMIASAMVEWKNGWEAENPDQPVQTYSGVELPEDVKRRDLIQSQRTAAARAINNAVGEMAELAELLSTTDAVEAAQLSLLNSSIESLKALSDEIDPRRAAPAPAPLLEERQDG